VLTGAVISAFPYWGDFSAGTIARANLDGSGVNESFITGASRPCGVAVDAAHIYWSQAMTVGRANLDGSGINQSFIGPVRISCGVAVDSLSPSTFFTFPRKAKLNRKKGTALLLIRVSGSGILSLRGKGVVGRRIAHRGGAGTVRIPVKSKGKTKRKLLVNGRVKVKVTITFTPAGGSGASKSRSLTLIRRKH
jgi:hypothetical protein